MSDDVKKAKTPGKHSKKINVGAVLLAIASPVGMYYQAKANAVESAVERSEKARANEGSVVVDLIRDRLNDLQKDVDACHDSLEETKDWAEEEFGNAHDRIDEHKHKRSVTVAQNNPEPPRAAPVKRRPAKAESLPEYDVVQQMAD